MIVIITFFNGCSKFHSGWWNVMCPTWIVMQQHMALASQSLIDTDVSWGIVYDLNLAMIIWLANSCFFFFFFAFWRQDGASLIRAVVSKEAIFFRQQLCRVIADVLYQCMVQTLGRGIAAAQFTSPVRLTGGPDNRELGSSSSFSAPINDYQSILRDRRLKVIFSRILDSARKDPALMLKFCWTSFVMVITALALACHRVLVSLSEAYFGPLSLVPKRVAISAWNSCLTLEKLFWIWFIADITFDSKFCGKEE